MSSHRKEKRQCAWQLCHREFKARASDIRRGKGRYCSWSCRSKARWATRLLAPGNSHPKVAKEYHRGEGLRLAKLLLAPLGDRKKKSFRTGGHCHGH